MKTETNDEKLKKQGEDEVEWFRNVEERFCEETIPEETKMS